MSICCKNCETLAAIAEERKQELVRYRKALEEIEELCIDYTHEFAGGVTVHYFSLDDILDIISKAKGGE